jgi:hypothetical protein
MWKKYYMQPFYIIIGAIIDLWDLFANLTN